MAIRRFHNRRPRLLAPSRILRPPPRQTGGGREREELVAAARQAIARGSRSFALATRLFDRATRERTWLLYAWCRRCDDLADGQEFGGRIGEEREAEHRIDAIRVLTRRALEGQPTADPAFDAFGQVALEAGLTRGMADDVIDGFALDAVGWRPRTEADLMRYCYHVAGAVAAMMARIMGVPDEEEETLDRACDLGLAFQLINIARDVWDDDAAGRCYLPLEWLAAADIPPGEHMKPIYRGKLAPLVARLLDMADRHLAAARHGAARLPLRQRWAVLSAANIYAALGQRVRARGMHAWDHRVATSASDQLRHAGRALAEALRQPAEPAEWPRWTRGELLIAVRMAGPVAPIPMTPLPDEEVK